MHEWQISVGIERDIHTDVLTPKSIMKNPLMGMKYVISSYICTLGCSEFWKSWNLKFRIPLNDVLAISKTFHQKTKIHPKNFAQSKSGLYIPPKSAESSFFVENVCFLFDCIWLHVWKYISFLFISCSNRFSRLKTSQIGISINFNLIAIH